MGIQDRDYYRDKSHGFLDAWGRQGVTVWIIVTTSVFFFLQCLSGPPERSPLFAFGSFNSRLIQEGEVWRLITPVFLHLSLFHIFFNMFTLYWVGIRLEDVRGPREFLAFYLLSGVFAHTVFFLAYIAGFAAPSIAAGASGAVTATLVLCAFYFPRHQILFFGVIPMPLWALVLLYIGFDTLGVFGAINGPIGYLVHLSGALFAAIYYLLGITFISVLHRPPRRTERRVRARPALRVVPVEPEEDTPTPVGAAVESQPRVKEAVDEQLEARLDQVLAKVSKLGQDSLTSEEREILFKASELYKKRRK